MSSALTIHFNTASIVSHFALSGHIAQVTSYGSGHINDTFLLKNADAAFPDYLLQRINHHVFKNVPQVIHNIDLVTNYLRTKNASSDSSSQQVLELVPTLDGQLFHKDENGNFWRVYLFIKRSRSYNMVETIQQAYEGGKAFGRFQAMLSDMNPDLLSETIVDFHNIKTRLADFHSALGINSFNRATELAMEIEFIEDRAASMSFIQNWGETGLLPKRITHNDTKFNNVLLDETDRVICIIDLDTVMPGHVAFDFGDAVRTIINTAAEDEPDTSRIDLNIPLFKAYTDGYMAVAGEFLTTLEIESLSLGVMLLPYMQGVRFLTDYLQGDTYFKTAYPEHNLVRARAQFNLLSKLEEKQQLLTDIITDAVADFKKRPTAPYP